MRRRTAASQTGLACETGMRRPWRFHPGRKIVAPRLLRSRPRQRAAMSLGAARRSSLAGSAKWTRTTIKRINSALPCRIGHRGMIELVDPLGLEPRPDGLRDRCAAVTPRVNIGTSLTNRTPFIAVRSRNAGSTGRGVEDAGALPTESNLVFSRLQGERRRIWLEGRIRQSPAILCKRLTNVSLATGDRYARTHTCHRWPVCYCYPVVKELRTQRRCAGRLSNSNKQKGPDACAIRALGHSTEAALTR